MSTVLAITPRDILGLQKEAEAMGRNYYTCPKVHKTSARRARWYFRPSIPVLNKRGRMRPKLGDRVYLGFCDEATLGQAKKARAEICSSINTRKSEMILPKTSMIGAKFIERSGDQGIIDCSSIIDKIHKTNIGPSSKGSAGEYLVIADLLLKGYEVFASADKCSSCDLVAYDGTFHRVEVKFSNGNKAIPIRRQHGKFDILAIVAAHGGITYQAASGIDSATVKLNKKVSQTQPYGNCKLLKTKA